MKVSMLEFLRTGKYGPIKVGMSREQVQHILGEPENWGVPSRKVKSWENAGYWIYGNIELHFIEERLWSIYSERFAQLKGGAAIELDPWILKGGATRSILTKALAEQRIEFIEAVVSFNDSIYVVCKSGVRLTFEENKSIPKNGLYAVFRSAHNDGSTTPLTYKLIGHIEHFYDRVGVVRVQLLPADNW